MEKIFLSTFIVKVQDGDKNDQILSRFNGADDFYNIFKNYLNSIFQNILDTADMRQTTSLYLTLDAPPTIDLPNRRVYGYVSTGVGGEKYNIRDVDLNENILDVQRNHAAFRNLFFYFQVREGANFGALVLQKKAKYGIKTILTKTINDYIKEQGYQNYKVIVNNILNGQVYTRMIEHGSLKRVELIRRQIPNSLEEYYANGGNHNQISGTLKTVITSSSGLPEQYKRVVDRLFRDPNLERIEIVGAEDDFDEIEFELELNGKKKTFFVSNRQKIQPDIDVTNELEYVDGEPTEQSLLQQCEEMVQDTIEIRH